MPFSKKARTRLAEQFAEIYQATQEEYRRLLSALRDESVDVNEFSGRVDELSDSLLKLKRIHVQLVQERDELRRELADGPSAQQLEEGDAPVGGSVSA